MDSNSRFEFFLHLYFEQIRSYLELTVKKHVKSFVVRRTNHDIHFGTKGTTDFVAVGARP